MCCSTRHTLNFFALFLTALATPGLEQLAFTSDGTHPSRPDPGWPSALQLASAERDRALRVTQDETATTGYPTWQTGKGLSLIGCLLKMFGFQCYIMQHSNGVGYIKLSCICSLYNEGKARFNCFTTSGRQKTCRTPVL